MAQPPLHRLLPSPFFLCLFRLNELRDGMRTLRRIDLCSVRANIQADKRAFCVDLGESFQLSIYLQNLASTSLISSRFARSELNWNWSGTDLKLEPINTRLSGSMRTAQTGAIATPPPSRRPPPSWLTLSEQPSALFAESGRQAKRSC